MDSFRGKLMRIKLHTAVHATFIGCSSCLLTYLHHDNHFKMGTKLVRDEIIGTKRFADFEVAGNVFIVTGGARGLGLAIAEGLVEAGGKGTWYLCIRRKQTLTDDSILS